MLGLTPLIGDRRDTVSPLLQTNKQTLLIVKAISILVGNLNLGRSYLIATVPETPRYGQ